MEVRLEFPEGVAVVSCAHIDELRQVLELARSGGYLSKNGDSLAPSGRDHAKIGGHDDTVFRRLLKRLQGQKAALVLQAIARSDDASASDDDLRKALPENLSLAPTFSHISKACRKEGIKPDKLYVKKTRRGVKGKMHYRYILTPRLAELIREFKDFDKLPDEPEDFEWDAN